MQNAHPEIWRSHPEKRHPPYFQNLIGLTGVMENPIRKKRRKVERDVVESCPGIFARRAYTNSVLRSLCRKRRRWKLYFSHQNRVL
jgi:hypothetical protein